MEPLAATLGVPWQQWAVLAAAAWVFALICFVGAFGGRSAAPHSKASPELVLLDTRSRHRSSRDHRRAA